MKHFRVNYRSNNESGKIESVFVLAANESKALKAFHLKVNGCREEDVLSIDPVTYAERKREKSVFKEPDLAGNNQEKGEQSAASNISNISNLSRETLLESETKYSLLPLLLFSIAGLALVAGLGFSANLWPSDPGYNQERTTLAYVPSFTWLSVAVTQFAFFAALGQGLHYLKIIAEIQQMPRK